MLPAENTSSQASSCSRACSSIGASAGSSSTGASAAQTASSGTCSRSLNESRTSGKAPRLAIARTTSSTSGTRERGRDDHYLPPRLNRERAADEKLGVLLNA